MLEVKGISNRVNEIRGFRRAGKRKGASQSTLVNTMCLTNLGKVGGSVMLAVPPALLRALGLRAGTKVAIGAENGRWTRRGGGTTRFTNC